MKSYVKKNLIHGEYIVYTTSYHWVIFINLKALLSLFIIPLLSIYSDEFAITNKRVIIKTGLFSRHTLELNLNKIESVNVKQSILGRMFGYGNIQIIGTGGTRETFIDIRNALIFRKKFQENC
jgi:uncharacterized membrane protein YdbT with pleckstrin-like domain